MSQLPNPKGIIQKTGMKHKNSRPMSRGRSSVREVNPIAAIAKTDYFRSDDMKEAVRDFPCGHCGREHNGTCGAHGNNAWMGKGGGVKSHDLVAGLCVDCHVPILDQGKDLSHDERERMFLRAFYQTMLHGFRSGKFVVVK